MKNGLQVGDTAVVHTLVAPEMFAQFEGEVVHPAFSTVSLVYHMEWASRKIILPYLDDGEEGMGAAVTVKHIAPAAEGDLVTVTATVTELQSNAVMTKVIAQSEDRIIGAGEVKQVILPKREIDQKLRKSIQ